MPGALVEFVAKTYRSAFSTLQTGTGESPLTLPFYEELGFRFSHCIPDFFAKNDSHPIVEGGVVLKDMIVLRRPL